MSNGRVFVITGANSGLGLETARILAGRSADGTVILACRDLGRGEDARLAIGMPNVRTAHLDVSSLSSVREFAAAFEGQLDALICNAGISHGPSSTVDGVDGVFATNHLGHFLLTELLLDRMPPTGRVISVSSDMHSPPGPKLTWPSAAALARPGNHAVGRLRYSYSKLCNLYFVYELSRRLRADGSDVSVAAFNPGLMTETNFASMPRAVGAVMRRIFAARVGSLATSSAALASLAADPQLIDGLYFDRSTRPTRSSELSYDIPNAVDLWQESARLSGLPVST